MTGPRIDAIDGVGPVYGPIEGDDLPGVVILHGSEGPMAGWNHRFAVILAMHGILALPLAYGEGDYFGVERIEDVDVSPALAAVEALGAQPRCRGAGLFGWSMGGTLTLLVASGVADAAQLPFAAAHAPLDAAPEAFEPERFRAGEGRDGAADAPRAFRWAGHDDLLTPGRPIGIERYQGPVFLSTGDGDSVTDPARTRRLAARLKAAGNTPDLFIASGQDHALDFGAEPQLWARLSRFIGRAV